ncbi:dipeptidase [Gorillibacterium massiliense]|uniref:dipeptidase n=1 Tax=Gorillibacterium massiliense TaxID=1280390 RepID=UPI0004ACF629|nr:dipeptidase [Gorillibacterium massiliense]
MTTVDYAEYFANKREGQLNELQEWLRIPSISALSEHKEDVNRAAKWLADTLTRAGLEHVEIFPTEGHPVVYADHLHAPGKPTVLIYGHYDVQPVDPLHLWETPPFEPAIRDNKLYARGATDDKGQLFLHVLALRSILEQEGKLPVNVKLCIEGEEEITSPNLPGFLDVHKDKLAADMVLISDTELMGPDKPAICTGLRGLCSLDVAVYTAKTDMHSGTYGGGVPNALHAIVSLLNTLHDEKGRVSVAGFYDDVPDLTPAVRKELAKRVVDTDELKEMLGLHDLFGEEGYTYVEQVGARPTLELNGVYGGFQGEGTKTVIPREAHAKITCRLVGQQKPQDILDKIEAHLHAHCPPGSKLEIVQRERGNPFDMNPDTPILQKAADAFEQVYGARPVFTKDGGSIPIIEALSRIVSAPVVLMGFGLPDENLHAPNEHFHLENFDKGLLTLVDFLHRI